MKINAHHLTYCTNIHPGESWEETFQNLKEYVLKVKSRIAPKGPFGIGLRLSDKASRSLQEAKNLAELQQWLEENRCYVFTMNGFPFGGFHHQSVKDQVHHPDWTNSDRLEYTLRLFDILENIIPFGVDGGISTSPLSYRFWKDSQNDRDSVYKSATRNIVEVAAHLHKIYQRTTKLLHLDIEPEPDGLLENTQEVIDWYKNWLIPLGTQYLQEQFGFCEQQAQECLRNHVQLCYDVCHFALAYEDPKEVFCRLAKEGISVGKIQISAALKAELSGRVEKRKEVQAALERFVESTYLHQVVQRDSDGALTGYPDLPQALDHIADPAAREWRIHFHVPVFTAHYGPLQSTQEEIEKVLECVHHEKVTKHLEVETYTWEVLPDDMQVEIVDSIVRELQWVLKKL